MKSEEIKARIKNGEYDSVFCELYGSARAEEQKARWCAAVDSFCEIYGGRDRDLCILSVPGRSEISGNHTDHNNGRVMAASIDLDIIAVAAKSENNIINVKSEGFSATDTVCIDDLTLSEGMQFRSSAIVCGVCDGFAKRGYALCGFDAYTTSQVLKGSGLSSSAAFEVMIGTILSHLANDGKVSQVELAQIAQYAENEFFGKPCGLMDQLACALGGLITIDFEDTKNPKIEKLAFDMSSHGYSLCIVNTGGSHSDLNSEYAAIPAEMKKVAEFFGKSVLRGLTHEDIIKNAAQLRRYAGDRAILRALHFLSENERVTEQSEALKNEDIEKFLDITKQSGRSSFMWLQNVFNLRDTEQEGIALALRMTEAALDGVRCAYRVHGGGFAGTMLAILPNENVSAYAEFMDGVFGAGACRRMRIRQRGAERFI